MDETNEIYNQPLAVFTFGEGGIKNTLENENPSNRKSNNILNSNDIIFNSIKKNKKSSKQNINIESNNNNNNYFENNSAQNYNIIQGNFYELTFGRDNNLTTNPSKNNSKEFINIKDINNNINNLQPNNYSILINPEGMNDSYIFSVIYSIHHMKLFSKYIINYSNNEFLNTNNISLLSNLKDILNQMDKNKFINISNFRNDLFNLYQNHRKFLIGQPDDPSDLLFVLINSIHSLSINSPLNEISDENCTEKCFSHKFLWLDLSRIDRCKCSGKKKRLFSNHNYITDIPIPKIFNLMKIKNINKDLFESNKKLFEYYTNLVARMKMNCPVNGQRCPINKTFHKLHLANSPSYLIFNLEQDFKEYNNLNYSFSAINILKNFVLIPNKFDIWNLFELNSKKNKNDFDFIGCILFKISKVYSCAFKNRKGFLVYYYCNYDIINNNNVNNFIEFVSYYDFVFFCIKNGLIPIILFYQGSFLTSKEKNKNLYMNNYEECLDKEQIDSLEKFCIGTDNLGNVLKNNLRIKENLIISKIIKDNNNINKKDKSEYDTNNVIINEYNCPNCNYKNKLKDKICINCANDNIEYLSNKIIIKDIPENIVSKKESQSMTHLNIIKNRIKPLYLSNIRIKKSQGNLKAKNILNNNNNKIDKIISQRKKHCISPDVKYRDKEKLIEKYNFEAYKEKSEKYLLNVPITYFHARRNNLNQKYFLNKTEIEDNDNMINFNKNKMYNISPKITKGKIVNKLTKHKRVLSSSENTNLLNNNPDNYKNLKSHKVSRTIATNKNFNKNNFSFNGSRNKKNKIYFFHLRSKNNNDNINQNNENTPIYPMNYSYNNIYLEQNDKKRK